MRPKKNPRSDRDSRGYGLAHKKRREREARKLKHAGQVPCARCGYPVFYEWPLSPPEPHAPKCPAVKCEGTCWAAWDLGHTDDRAGYNGIEHRSCNRSAGAVNSNKPKARFVPGKDYGW
ncbi:MULTISPECIES: hypothetical protein [unclassified Collinsella]|jgi:hypothetical protein|uniref:hypothetical protein n=2 Tax=Collinsella TaxID=102106 RepID=UPI003F8F87C5